MTTFIVSIQGLTELDRALANAPQEMPALIERANTTAAPVVKTATQRETPVRTGFLRDSEDVFVRGSELEFQAAAAYASFVAYGTSRQRANPYSDRGVAAAEPQVVAEFEREADVFVRGFAT